MVNQRPHVAEFCESQSESRLAPRVINHIRQRTLETPDRTLIPLALNPGDVRKAARYRGRGAGRQSSSAGHLDFYPDEIEWRFNNRKNPFLFRDTMLKLIASS
jgi:hypothetical protein